MVYISSDIRKNKISVVLLIELESIFLDLPHCNDGIEENHSWWSLTIRQTFLKTTNNNRIIYGSLIGTFVRELNHVFRRYDVNNKGVFTFWFLRKHLPWFWQEWSISIINRTISFTIKDIVYSCHYNRGFFVYNVLIDRYFPNVNHG
jgi:hypothetical protein